MKAKTPISLTLAITALLVGSPAIASRSADQGEYLWRELQRSEGTPLERTFPPPCTGSNVSAPAPVAQDWFAIERQKTEGYIAPQSQPAPESARVRKEPPRSEAKRAERCHSPV